MSFWRAVELFSPQTVPSPTQRTDHRVERWLPQGVEPWVRAPKLPPHPTDPARTKVWRHTVYLGVFSIGKLYEALDRRFEPDRESYDPRPPGDSALAAITVDEHGVLVEDSAILSGCGWATGRASDPGPGDARWLDGFSAAAELWQEAVDRIANQLVHPRHPVEPDRDADDAVSNDGLEKEAGPAGAADPERDDLTSAGRRPLTSEAIEQIAAMTRKFVGFPPEVDSAEVRFSSRQVTQQTADTTPADFLNSFFLADLDLIAQHARDGHLGAGLTTYLRERPVMTRIDVSSDLAAVLDRVAPAEVPLGRWPSDPGKPLALSQQLAADLALGAGEDGLVAVNGPPGTGKTTLLREIYAGLLVERADVLATLASPSDGFDRRTVHVWDAAGHPRRVVPLIGRMTGFEMVVASSNNAAVANVSQEIPTVKSVDARYAGAVDYFADVATALLQPEPPAGSRRRTPEPSQGSSTQQAWALTAARLGRKKYRSEFRSRFWLGTDSLGVDYTAMLARLKEWRDAPPPTSWADAVQSYRSARGVEQRARAARAEVARKLGRQQRLAADLASMRQRLTELVAAQADARTRAAAADDAFRTADEAASAAVGSRRNHQGLRPGLLQTIVTWGRALRTWSDADVPLAEAVASTEQARATRYRERADARATLSSVENRRLGLDGEIGQIAAEESRLSVQVDAATAEWGAAVPDPSWWHDVVRRELTAPWADPALNDARSTTVLAALTLHRSFLHHNARTMFANLQAACEVVAGVAPHELDPAATLAAWQSLFLVVPLVSTTFASYDRMFGRLGPESLGWLFVDEAGQASPAHAVGALWRSRHSVVVGDPRQLRPVLTIPPRLEGAMAEHYRVSAKWRPHRTSVQELADEVSRWGTTLTPTDSAVEGLWVGAPLRVHRRCDQPMLDICNSIAYPVADTDDPRVSGLMIDAVGPREPFGAPASQWYDVVSSVADGHFVPAELNELKTRLFDVLHRGTPPSSVICISPFRDTARELERLAEDYKGLRAGTIHTAQGQEADVVFLVLGSNPAKNGARQWAAAEPNLLNVAVSRAKRRLYVIGDTSAWSKQRYFDVVAAQLDRTPVGPEPSAVPSVAGGLVA